MNLVSVIIPAKNEAKNITATIEGIRETFKKENINYDIIVVNDGSTDELKTVVQTISQKDSRVRLIDNQKTNGFGNAIKQGLENYWGDIVIITMADASDDPADMVHYVRTIDEGADCCFGTRWCKEAQVEGYPPLKYALNRFVNGFINVLFGLGYNDTTNAFKAYSRQTVEGIKPILARHFNITVELPLKAIVRGYSYKVIPTHWRERKKGVSKLKIQEMGSRYLFIILYVFLEKLLCKGDYKKIGK